MSVSHIKNEKNPCKSAKNICIIIRKKYEKLDEKRKKIIDFSNSIRSRNLTTIARQSMPILSMHKTTKILRTGKSATAVNTNNCKLNYVVNAVLGNPLLKCHDPFNNLLGQARCTIYRCQLNTKEETCCCSCNSDAMFEVMKSLYDCYKKKNCDHCNCILCGHLPKQERHLGEIRKSAGQIGEAISSKKKKKEKLKKPAMGQPLESEFVPGKAKSKKFEIAALDGKTPSEKIKILQKHADIGVALPEGRTPSERVLIDKIKTEAALKKSPSEKIRKAKKAGLLTPIQGKTPEQKEKILKGLAMLGIPLPDGKTASEKKLIKKVRKDVGLPPEPKTPSLKETYKKAMETGIITPLEGKSTAKKEKILKAQADLGIPLPEGQTLSEKKIISKIKATARVPSVVVPSEKIRKAKAAGLLTPLSGKSPEQKENILRSLAIEGIPLPEANTSSEKKILDKVRTDLGLPPEPKTEAVKKKYKKAIADGIITPLEGKSLAEKEKILKSQAEMGIPLPEGRTPSEKALIAKIKTNVRPPSEGIPSPEKVRRAKAAGILTPLEGKTPEQKENIFKGLAMHGLPLPEAKTPSEKKLFNKVRNEIGLPPEPKSLADKENYKKAQAAGLIEPLEGKTPKEKEKILRDQADFGISLPEGRTPSERELIASVKKRPRVPSLLVVPSEKLRKARAAGVLTPLEGKTPAQKENILKGLAMHGIPLPEAKNPSEKKIIDKVRNDLGLPPEPKTSSEKNHYNKGMAAGVILPLEGKTPLEKEKILKAQVKLGIPLPEGRTSSEKALIKKIQSKKPEKPALSPEKTKKLDAKTLKIIKEGKGPSDECICSILTPKSQKVSLQPKLSKLLPHKITSENLKFAKDAGLLTPLAGKTLAQKEKIIKGLAKRSLPLPEGKTASEKKLIDKVRTDMGLPPEPKTPAAKEKYAKAQAAGVITPLEGKTASHKEKILRKQAEMGLSLPEGRTASEKALINKVKTTTLPRISSERLRKGKFDGLLTPLEGKTLEEKEKILKGRVAAGLPLPKGQTSSENELVKKIKATPGYISPVSKVPAGVMIPSMSKLKGKSPSQKEKILRTIAKQGHQLPEGKTPSEKALISKIKATEKASSTARASSEMLRKAKAAGLLNPLEGKSAPEKEIILKRMHATGIALPEGKTTSEKSMIRKIKASSPVAVPSEKLRAAKAAGLLTPLPGKTPSQKEKIIKGLAKAGLPLPDGKTPSEKEIIKKVRKDMGLPQEPKTPSEKEKTRKAYAAGLVIPLEGKTPIQKEKILRKLAEAGAPLPEGRTKSEKALIKKVQTEVVASPSKRRIPSRVGPPALPIEKRQKLDTKTAKLMKESKGPSDECLCSLLTPESEREVSVPKPSVSSKKISKADAAEILTSLAGKTAKQKEKMIKNMAKKGQSLPKGRTPSEKKLIDKVRKELGLPAASKPSSTVSIAPALSEKLRKAKAAGLLTPLQGKPAARKAKILKNLAMEGLPLPEGKTPSEKKLIDKVREDLGLPPEPKTSSEKSRYNKAMEAGAIIPLEGKTPSQKKRILQNQAKLGIPLPIGRTRSEKALIDNIKAGIKSSPPSGIHVPSEKLRKAKEAGLLTPLDGKTTAQKEKILKGLAMEGLPLPESRTKSEKKLVDKIREELGLPPEPKTSSEKNKYNKGIAAGVIIPLEGKTPAEKEKILQNQAKLGIPLPTGRTRSEKDLIETVKADIKSSPASDIHVPSEKLRKAKEAGLLTPLDGKTTAQKEKILKGLAMEGLPLPESRSKSEKNLIDKIRGELGLPPEPKTSSEKNKYNKGIAAGVIMPLEGKTPAEKEKILQNQAKLGIPLPTGRTLSEKALIDTIKTDFKSLLPSVVHVPSKKLRKAKEAGLLTPLEGKTTAQKEKILKGLAMEGLPLPESRTKSEKKLIDKIRSELGLPPEPKTSSEKNKYNKGIAAGAIIPLEGKSPAEKDKILRNQAKLGIPLPKGRTRSEKALIDGVKADIKLSQPLVVSSKTLQKAKTAGLLTPLDGKTPEQKKKILKGLAEAGIPLPEGKTQSEKGLISKVKAETKRNVSPRPSFPILAPEKRQKLDKKTAKIMKEGKGPSDECMCTLLTPSSSRSGKRTSSRKLSKAKSKQKHSLQHGRKASELSPKRTSSEKVGKIKTKSRKIGSDAAKRSGKSISALKKAAGIEEEFQDILKSTTCDRACGCDKKKIRFKHSYVKIRVTSPDISSLCPCPDECVPGVKSGVLTDNEGIKVTVGRAVGVPSFSVEAYKNNIPTSIYFNDNFTTISEESVANDAINSILGNFNKSTSEGYQNMFHNTFYKSLSKENLGGNFVSYTKTSSTADKFGYDCEPCDILYTDYTTYDSSNKTYSSMMSSISTSLISKDASARPESSFGSIYIIKTESSLSLSTWNTDSFDRIRVISLMDNSVGSHSSNYLCYSQSEVICSDQTNEEYESFSNQIDYSSAEDYISKESFVCKNNCQSKPINGFTKNTNVLIFRVSGVAVMNANESHDRKMHRDKSVLIVNDLNSEHDIKAMVDEIISNNLVEDVSSVFIVVASSDNMTECPRYSSSVYIQMLDKLTCRNIDTNNKGLKNHNQRANCGLKINTRGNIFHKDQLKVKNKTVSENKSKRNTEKVFNRRDVFKNNGIGYNNEAQVVSVDTTCDRPCCCQPKTGVPPVVTSSGHRSANVVSELVTPMIKNQSIAQGLNDKAFINIPVLAEPWQSAYDPIKLKPMPVTSCMVPPCSGHKSCHDIESNRQQNTLNPSINRSGPSRHCHQCGHNINSELTYNCSRKCTAIGGSIPENSSYAICGRPNQVESKNKNCLCSGKEKRVRIDPKCPCRVYNRPPTQESVRETKSVSCQRESKDIDLYESKDACICKNKKRSKKNTTCDCPEVAEPEELAEQTPWIDEKLIRKIQSEMTQTTSGFKIHKKKRVPLEEQMSYQDIMNYYNSLVDNNDAMDNLEGCVCKIPRKKAKDIDCECPFEPQLLQAEHIQDTLLVKGLKFQIGGKGSGSRGLSGICCFDMIHENKHLMNN